ncbi:MAG: hypothetical protein NXH73_11020 [Flavobacteriaceae bacterium]|nr:hypothetical protein [Flavobacteriaceae bacterium]
MENQNNQVMSVKDWFITVFVAAIPLVGLIMLFVWAFGSSTNASKTNWAKAVLLWYAVIFVLYILIAVIFGAAFLTGMGDMDMNY